MVDLGLRFDERNENFGSFWALISKLTQNTIARAIDNLVKNKGFEPLTQVNLSLTFAIH